VSDHADFTIATGTPVYFCDPLASLLGHRRDDIRIEYSLVGKEAAWSRSPPTLSRVLCVPRAWLDADQLFG
jgi:hypothetical protein